MQVPRGAPVRGGGQRTEGEPQRQTGWVSFLGATHSLQSHTKGRCKGAISRVPWRKGLRPRIPHRAPQVAATLGALQAASLQSLDINTVNCLLRLECSLPPCVPSCLTVFCLSRDVTSSGKPSRPPGWVRHQACTHTPCVHTCMCTQVHVHMNAHACTHTQTHTYTTQTGSLVLPFTIVRDWVWSPAQGLAHSRLSINTD